MSTDAELLQRYVREDSHAAFAELVRRHLPLVYSAALRQLGGDAHLAQDVAQEVFAALARKCRTLGGRASLAGWLYLGTHHAAAQTVRALRRRRAREQEAHLMHEMLAAENGAADWTTVRPVLDDAMRQLGATEREAVLLRYFARRPFDEIGAALDLSSDAARMRVERALEKLRRVLAARGIASTGAALATMLADAAATTLPEGLAGEVSRAALAGSGSGVAAGSFPMIFMQAPTFLVGVVAVAGLGLAGWQYYAVQRAENRARVLEGEVAALRSEAAEARRMARQAGEARYSLLGTPPAVAAASAKPPATLLAGANPVVGTMSFRSADGRVTESMPVAFDPEGRRRQAAEVARRSYAALFAKLGWTDAQRDLFVALFAERKEQGQRLFEAARREGVTVDATFAQVVWDQTGAEFEERLREAMGDGAVAGLREFEATKIVRNLTDVLARDLADTAAPLLASQVEPLIAVLAAAARTPSGKIDLAAVPAARLVAQAGPVLSPVQAEALARRLQERGPASEAMR